MLVFMSGPSPAPQLSLPASRRMFFTRRRHEPSIPITPRIVPSASRRGLERGGAGGSAAGASLGTQAVRPAALRGGQSRAFSSFFQPRIADSGHTPDRSRQSGGGLHRHFCFPPIRCQTIGENREPSALLNMCAQAGGSLSTSFPATADLAAIFFAIGGAWRSHRLSGRWLPGPNGP